MLLLRMQESGGGLA